MPIILLGGSGNDRFDLTWTWSRTVDGGEGSDTVWYDPLESSAGIKIDLSDPENGTAQVITSNGSLIGDIDTLVSIENIWGTGNKDVLIGNAGSNTLNGFYGSDVLQGGDGDDVYVISGGFDTIYDTGGSDLLRLTGSSAALHRLSYAQDGNDLIITASWVITPTQTRIVDFFGGGTIEYIEAEAGVILDFTQFQQWIVSTGSGTIYGTEGDDIIIGTSGNDVIDGLGGNDTIYGAYGNDTIYGGADNDFLYGGFGDDKLYGQDGNDYLAGGSGYNTLDGGAGEDVAETGDGGVNTVYGGDDNDVLGGYNVYGGGGNDLIYGTTGSDTLRGQDGHDLIIGSKGSDYIDGGAGIDTVDYSGALSGISLISFTFGKMTVSGGSGNDTVWNFENVIGTNHNDTFKGGSGDQVFVGGMGDDTFTIALGSDSYIGGLGNDFYDIYANLSFNLAISDDGGWDDHILLRNVSASNIIFTDMGDDLEISFAGSSSMITILGQNAGGESQIEYITLSDGTVIQLADPPPNENPVALDDSFITTEGEDLSGNLLADNGNGADYDPDEHIPLVLVAGTFTTAQGGTVVLYEDGSFDYTPAEGFFGEDSFDYTLVDQRAGTDTGTATITVEPLPYHGPSAQNDVFTVEEGQTFEGNLLVDNGSGADFDADGDVLSVAATTISTTLGGLVIICIS